MTEDSLQEAEAILKVLLGTFGVKQPALSKFRAAFLECVLCRVACVFAACWAQLRLRSNGSTMYMRFSLRAPGRRIYRLVSFSRMVSSCRLDRFGLKSRVALCAAELLTPSDSFAKRLIDLRTLDQYFFYHVFVGCQASCLEVRTPEVQLLKDILSLVQDVLNLGTGNDDETSDLADGDGRGQKSPEPAEDGADGPPGSGDGPGGPPADGDAPAVVHPDAVCGDDGRSQHEGPTATEGSAGFQDGGLKNAVLDVPPFKGTGSPQDNAETQILPNLEVTDALPSKKTAPAVPTLHVPPVAKVPWICICFVRARSKVNAFA